MGKGAGGLTNDHHVFALPVKAVIPLSRVEDLPPKARRPGDITLLRRGQGTDRRDEDLASPLGDFPCLEITDRHNPRPRRGIPSRPVYHRPKPDMLLNPIPGRHVLEVGVNLRLQRKLLRPVRVGRERVRVKVRSHLFNVPPSSAKRKTRQENSREREGGTQTSHPQPGYEFAHQVPPIWSDFSTSSKFLVLYWRSSWMAKPIPDAPAPMMRTSTSWFMVT